MTRKFRDTELVPKPTFLVIGAGRSGTTSIHHYLRHHPDVFVPSIKAPSYFYAIDKLSENRREAMNRSFVSQRSKYFGLFEGSQQFVARGEVSPAYLASTRVPGRIAEEIRDVRLIAVIRDPTDRFIARFVARRRDGLERRTTIAEIVEHELNFDPVADDSAGTYLQAGLISHVLGRYLETFGEHSLTLLLYDDLRRDPRAFMKRIFDSIGVDSSYAVDTTVSHNASRGEVPGLLGGLWRGSIAIRQLVRPFFPQHLRDLAFRSIVRRSSPSYVSDKDRLLLDDYYRDEVTKLAALSGRDLSHWGGGTAQQC